MPELLADDADYGIVILAGQPKGWGEVIKGATKALAEVREESNREGVFAASDSDHRRGNFLAIASGVSFGGGAIVSS